MAGFSSSSFPPLGNPKPPDKREKEKLYAKRLKQEKKLDANHALELEIEMLWGQLQVKKVKKKMVKIQEELKEKEQALEELNQHTEMQEASASVEKPSAYEILETYNFPIGIFPKGVVDYTLETDTGKFSASFNGSCSF